MDVIHGRFIMGVHKVQLTRVCSSLEHSLSAPNMRTAFVSLALTVAMVCALPLDKREPQLSSMANMLPDPVQAPVKSLLNQLPIKKRQLGSLLGLAPDQLQGPLKALGGAAGAPVAPAAATPVAKPAAAASGAAFSNPTAGGRD